MVAGDVIAQDGAAGRVYASEAQLRALENMREIVRGEAELEEIQHFDEEVGNAGRGPLYFNLVVMLYHTWSEKYKGYLESVGSYVSEGEGEDEEEGSDDDLAGMLPAARKTGVVSVRALLSGLRGVYAAE